MLFEYARRMSEVFFLEFWTNNSFVSWWVSYWVRWPFESQGHSHQHTMTHSASSPRHSSCNQTARLQSRYIQVHPGLSKYMPTDWKPTPRNCVEILNVQNGPSHATDELEGGDNVPWTCKHGGCYATDRLEWHRQNELVKTIRRHHGNLQVQAQLIGCGVFWNKPFLISWWPTNARTKLR